MCPCPPPQKKSQHNFVQFPKDLGMILLLILHSIPYLLKTLGALLDLLGPITQEAEHLLPSRKLYVCLSGPNSILVTDKWVRLACTHVYLLFLEFRGPEMLCPFLRGDRYKVQEFFLHLAGKSQYAPDHQTPKNFLKMEDI